MFGYYLWQYKIEYRSHRCPHLCYARFGVRGMIDEKNSRWYAVDFYGLFFTKFYHRFSKMKLFTWAEIFCVGWAAFNENCPNMEGVAECETNCESNFIECQLNCDGDVNCVSACNRIFVTCEASCPCHDNCFEVWGSPGEIIYGPNKICPLNSG